MHARTYFHIAICTKLESSKRTDVRFRFDGNVGNKSQVSNRVVVILIGKRRDGTEEEDLIELHLKTVFDLPS